MTPKEYLDVTLRHGHASAARTLGDERAKDLSVLVWKRYDAIDAMAPRFRQRMNWKLFVATVPLLALYKTLREDFGMQQDPALGLADQMMRDAYAARLGILMIAALNATYQLQPIRNLIAKQMWKTDEPEGFRFEKVDEPGALLAFDVRSCPIVNFAKQHGAPEIVPLICRLDDLIAGYLSGIELHRSGTIGMGAERCDFRYVRKPKA